MRIAFLSALLVSQVTLATQVVVTDVTYTHSATTTTDSHYRVVPNAGTPANWVSPVDYTKGKAYVRLEVFTKPNTTTQTRFQICFEATPSYACTDQAPAYTSPGVYTWATDFVNFYQYNQVDWTKGTVKLALILKDTMNVKPAPENVGATTAALYMPTNLRVTVTLVSQGATYVPPAASDAGMMMTDAGKPDAGGSDSGIPDAGSKDAGVAVDAGNKDAGSPVDAGPVVDSGTPVEDSGTPEVDSGTVVADAGHSTADAGTPKPQPQPDPNVGCTQVPGPLMLAALLALTRRRRAL